MGTLPTFFNCQDLKNKIKELREAQAPVYTSIPWWPIMPFFSGGFSASFGASGGMSFTFASPPGEGDSGGASYSTTNTQVAGVDEADIVKNDSTFIYMIKDNSVRIVRARPIDEMLELSNISYDGTDFIPAQLYVDGDILVVIGKENNFTKILIYDITDRTIESLTRTLKFKARYLQSRKVDNMLYLIMNENPPSDINSENLLPTYHDSGVTPPINGDQICNCSDIPFLPGYTEPNYLIIVSIDINNTQAASSRELILGKSENVYASRDNLYVTSTAYLEQEPVVFHPWLFIPWAIRSKPSTMVYKFSLGTNSIVYEGKNRIPGATMNQFCMDEYDDGSNTYFRMATTIRSEFESNLYVLDNEMVIAGFLRDITSLLKTLDPDNPDNFDREELKAVRFVGDRAYFVTFERTDPLIVISLADNTDPAVLGMLQLPGYSQYIHPYDENHIIGFGRDVENNWELGVKVTLFDATDMTDPTEVSTINIGCRYSASEVLLDHKALLFSKEKNLMAFPILETQQINPGDIYNIKYIFQGANVYYIDESTIYEVAKRTHHDPSVFPASSQNWNQDDNIRRVIYIDEYMYTISPTQIRAVDMNNYPQDPAVYDDIVPIN